MLPGACQKGRFLATFFFLKFCHAKNGKSYSEDFLVIGKMWYSNEGEAGACGFQRVFVLWKTVGIAALTKGCIDQSPKGAIVYRQPFWGNRQIKMAREK